MRLMWLAERPHDLKLTVPLPEIREYVEREAHLGIWVRTPMADPNANTVLQVIATQVSQYPPEDLDWFYRSPTAGGDPVVFHGGPNDPLASIFQQNLYFMGRARRAEKLCGLLSRGRKLRAYTTTTCPSVLASLG